jgi:hypothetical protein
MGALHEDLLAFLSAEETAWGNPSYLGRHGYVRNPQGRAATWESPLGRRCHPDRHPTYANVIGTISKDHSLTNAS